MPAAASVLTANGAFTPSGASTDLSLPEVVTVGAALSASPRTTIFMDATWMRWSRYNELILSFDNNQPPAREFNSWDNSWRLSTGVKHSLTDGWDALAGFAWDETPLTDSSKRKPRAPDASRFWLSAGVSHALSFSTTISASFAHLFVQDSETQGFQSATGSVLNGSWEQRVSIFSLSLAYHL